MLLLVHADAFLKGKLIYVSNDLSFNTLDRQTQGVTSILINDINIDLSEDGEAVAIWGLSTKLSWQQGYVEKPESQPGRLRILDTLTPGVSIRVTQLGNYWPVIYDPSSGWLRIGPEESVSDQAIEFLSGCVLGLFKKEICSLWLHPEFQ